MLNVVQGCALVSILGVIPFPFSFPLVVNNAAQYFRMVMFSLYAWLL